MTPQALAQFAPRVMVHLADPALRSIVLACLAVVVLTAFRVRHVTAHLVVWTGVLYAALAMPLLAWLLPAIPVPLQIPAKQVETAPPISSAGKVGVPDQTAPVEPTERPSRFLRAADARALPQSGRQSDASGRLLRLASGLGQELGPALTRLTRLVPSVVALAVYTLGLIFLLARLALGLFLSRRLRRSSTRVDDPGALRWLEWYTVAMGPKSVPVLAESPAVGVPLTLGVSHPVIVIPSDWREWQSTKLAAVIAHEVSHVKRNDSRTRTLALLYKCIFWFSPLGWWLEHRLTDLAEQASDQAAVRAGTEPIYYAEVLMSFFNVSSKQGRVNWRGVSMARGLRAKDRIERVLSPGAALPATIKTPILVLFALCALPMVYLTAAMRPSLVADVSAVVAESPSQTVARLPLPEPPPPSAHVAPGFSYATPSASVVPAAPGAPRPVQAGVGAQPGPVTAAPSPPSPPPDPTGLSAPGASPELLSRLAPPAEPYSYPYSQSSGATATNSEDDAWLLSCVNTDGCGDITLANHFPSDQVNALRKKFGENFILFVHNGTSYVIRDTPTVKAAFDLFVPQKELARKQETLAKQQEELGRQQEALGKQQESVRVKVPSDLEARLKKVEAEIHELGSSATQDDLARLQGELGEIQGYLGELQGKAGEEQGKLGSRQGELGAQQGELGRKQGELGEEQGRIAQEAFRKMQGILRRALESGLAQRAPA